MYVNPYVHFYKKNMFRVYFGASLVHINPCLINFVMSYKYFKNLDFFFMFLVDNKCILNFESPKNVMSKENLTQQRNYGSTNILGPNRMLVLAKCQVQK